MKYSCLLSENFHVVPSLALWEGLGNVEHVSVGPLTVSWWSVLSSISSSTFDLLRCTVDTGLCFALWSEAGQMVFYSCGRERLGSLVHGGGGEKLLGGDMESTNPEPRVLYWEYPPELFHTFSIFPPIRQHFPTGSAALQQWTRQSKSFPTVFYETS